MTAAPTLELPKGGGALRSIGEKFQANPVTGSASMSVPIAVSPGRGGFGPSLSLSYDSGGGNGPFGVGWNLSAPTIQRKTDKGLPKYTDDDVFVMSDAEDLVPVNNREVFEDPITYSVTRYRPRIEGSNLKIEKWTRLSDGDVHWRTWSTSNVRRKWGTSADSRLTHPTVPGKTFAWYLDQERDEVGNLVVYEYEDETRDEPGTEIFEARRVATNRYLKRILYGNVEPDNAGAFYFEVVFDYDDHTADGREPDALTVPRRMDPYSRFRSGFDVRCTRLCRRVLMFHRFDDGLDSDAVLTKITSFAYNENPIATTLVSVTHTGVDPVGGKLSLPAVSFTYTLASQASTPAFLTGIEDLPNGLDMTRMQWVDLDGEGLSGLLGDTGDGFWYKRNEGDGALAPWRRLPGRPPGALSGMQLADLDSDGRLEMVVRAPGMNGAYTRTADDGWAGFRRFESVPATNGSDRVLDVDGDGLPDVLVQGPQGLTWYKSEGIKGWSLGGQAARPADEDTGPVALYQTDQESVFLADMTGDGLVDVVRVRNGRIDYWPNLGYGRFAPRVAMASAPRFEGDQQRFDARRVRFADVDGTGAADLVYLGPKQVRWWPNEAGNGFGDEQTVAVSVEDPVTISFADLRGDGTSCLVWSSPLGRDRLHPIRYVRLMTEGKPYLLETIENGFGRTTTLTYTPSTAFYVADRRAGTPWATRLPFPVHCLTTVVVEDSVTSWRFTSTYEYHHGFYDGQEREFRGFGRVDQRDAEVIEEGEEDDFAQPPVLTKTWFHTGAWKDEGTLEAAFQAEWWDGDTVTLTSSVVPNTREAHRAMKGRPLRVEVYAEDGAEGLEEIPYSVTRSTYTVTALAERIHRVDGRETVSEHVERGTDTRVGHELVLEVDDYGVVTRSASVAYGRASGDDPQTETVVVINTNRVVHDVEDDARWHIAVPTRSRTFHLGGFDDDYTMEALNDAFDEATALDWAEPPGVADLWKRRCSDKKVSYFDGSDEVFPTTTWILGSRVLTHQSYVRTFTNAQISASAAFEDRIDASDLEDAGYVELDGEDGWWTPSGTPTRDASHFFVTTAIADPFGNTTTVAWHPTYLFADTVTDALGNVVHVDVDLHYLAPWKVIDPNGNGSEVAFDELGRVIAMAVVGAASEGDTLVDPTATYEYNLDALPVSVRSAQRETHADIGTRWLESVAYSDGSGNVVHSKVMAAPDPITSDPRWIGSGRIVVDNKGNVIKQYEPFFSDNDGFELESDLAMSGVASTAKYDPLGRPIQVDLPNGTRRRVSFTPWESTTWDENDCADDSDLTMDPDLKARAEAHWNTPATVRFDSQGRVYATDELLTDVESHRTSLTLDVVGNPRVVTDALEVDTQTQVFDMLGRPIRTDSPDAGFTVAFVDVAGKPVHVWKSGDLEHRYVYDELQRQTELWATEASTERLKIKTEYSLIVGSGYFKGRVVRTADPAGLVTVAGYDFKGNVVGSERRFWDDVDAEIDWSTEPDPEDLVEATGYTSSVAYDAMNRPIEKTEPDDSVVRFAFDEGGALVTVEANVRADVSPTAFVTGIEYNARGQRVSIVYGNGITTAYTYEPTTFRLTRLLSTRASDSAVMQDLNYLYDPVGNIVSIENDAEDTLYFDNAAVDPHQQFEYDAWYRLTQASGRERASAAAPNGSNDDVDYDGSGIPDDSAVARYTEQYSYDVVGNIREFVHRQGGPSGTVAWRRRYLYEGEDTATWPPTGDQISNRLLQTSVPGSPSSWIDYVHDVRGSMVRMPHGKMLSGSDNIVTDFRDQMKHALLATSGQDALYFYDAGGQRVRKVVRRGANVYERRYLGGWESWEKRVSGSATDKRETLHVMDGEQRIAMVESKTLGTGSPLRVIRYQHSNHLGTAILELDGDAEIISYEELHPYGSIAWWTQKSGTGVSQKRYRYTGMERDDETGLQRHGIRQYAPWLARWSSCDPSGLDAGSINFFSYCHGRPCNRTDTDGRRDIDPADEQRAIEAMASINDDKFFTSMTDQERTLWADAYLDQGTVSRWDALTKYYQENGDLLKGSTLEKIAMSRYGSMVASYDEGDYLSATGSGLFAAIEGMAGSDLFGETPGETAIKITGYIAFTLALGQVFEYGPILLKQGANRMSGPVLRTLERFVVDEGGAVPGGVHKLALGVDMPGRLARFADRFGLETYMSYYGYTDDLGELAQRLSGLMKGARELHFNLSSLRGTSGQFLVDDATGTVNQTTLNEILDAGRSGFGAFNITNWELAQVLDNPELLKKTTFYVDETLLSKGALP